ncbi:TPA: protein phosphatase 2C domain-containing protein [Enterobacter mori]|nr:protein phosphatase 2C domain-containing protein [Enterobacter mori]
MHDPLWNSWGASVIGPLHVKAGIPNQDSWRARRYKWGNVVVVSDGLGSKAHSDHGSKAACLAVFEAARNYQNTPAASVGDVLRLIHANWLMKIAPYASTECSATCLFVIQTEGTITLGRLGDGMIAVLGETDEHHLILSDTRHDSFSNFTNSLQQAFRPEQWEGGLPIWRTYRFRISRPEKAGPIFSPSRKTMVRASLTSWTGVAPKLQV